MKILTRYVLREHIGPLLFALAALTSLLMLQYVARQLGNLVGKGLPWRIIGEFFVLSLPFTVAMTMPMAVLVATLHAFGRMANEHEITAFKASGVRVTTLMAPVLVGAAFLAAGMVAFNDQVLPRANHRLRMLTQDMSRTKPTLALTEQVLNQVSNGFYMRISRIDNASNRIYDVTIYDMSAPTARKTIYADSGELSFTLDKKDLQLVLYDGFQQELYGQTSTQLRRSYFRSQAVRVRDVARDFEQTGTDSWKGDREKSICEMQSEYVVNARDYERVRQMYIETVRKSAAPGQKTMRVPKPRPASQGVARLYCNALALVFRVPTAQPAVVDPSTQSPATAQNNAPIVGGTGAPAPGTPEAQQAAAVAAGVPALSPGMQAQLEAARATIQGASSPPAPAPAPLAGQPGSVATAPLAQVGAPPTIVQALIDSAKLQTVPAVSPSDSAKRAAAIAAGSAAPPGAAGVTVSAPLATPPGTVVGAATGSVQNAILPPLPASVTTVPSTTAPPASPVAGQPPAALVSTGTGQPQLNAPVLSLPVTTAILPPPAVAIITPQPAATTPVPGVSPAASNTSVAMAALASSGAAEIAAVNSQLALVRASMDSLAVEVQKKFALSVACLVFVLFGPPIALRFPRGGVGATLGVSLVVFGLYYVCLMAGETLADGGKLPPVVAMWAANVIFTVLGILGLLRIEKTADASRAGGLKDWFEDRRAKRAMRAVRVPAPSAAA